MRDNKSLHMEFVRRKSGPIVFFYDLDFKRVIPPKEVKILKISIVGTRKAKDRKPTFKNKKDHIEIQFEKDSSYRYDITVEVSYKGIKQDMVKWRINP